jgi:hypothetical protein
VSLQGGPQLRARLKALKLAFKPVGKAWAETTIAVMRPQAPHRTGRGAASLRVKNATQKRATVSAIYYMAILDKGSKAHTIVPRKAKTLRFEVGGKAVFARRVNIRARQGTHFAIRAAKEALRRNPMAESLIAEWNAAAP